MIMIVIDGDMSSFDISTSDATHAKVVLELEKGNNHNKIVFVTIRTCSVRFPNTTGHWHFAFLRSIVIQIVSKADVLYSDVV